MSRGRASFDGRYPKEIFIVAENAEHWRQGEPQYWTHRIYSTESSAKAVFNRAVEDCKGWNGRIIEVQLLRIGVAHSGYELLANWRP